MNPENEENRSLYGGKLVLPDGKPWIGDESSGFPADELEVQDPIVEPPPEEDIVT